MPHHRRGLHRIGALVGLLLASLAPGFCQAEETALGAQTGVLLLRNGELIAGEILRSGDRYDVLLSDGEIRIKVSEVDLFCRDKRECYRRRRGGLDFGRVQDHLELAEWCLRHGLNEEAREELTAATAADSMHPKLALLRRRLDLATATRPEVAASVAPVDEGPTPDDLDRMLRGMPAGSVELFTNTIQPLLMNHCSTAGCHGPHCASPLRLTRTSAGRLTSRRATQRNLHSALSAIDRQQPDDSLLLTTPLRAHGSSKAPIFTSREAGQYKQLYDWVHQVSTGKPPSTTKSIERVSAVLPAAPKAEGKTPKATSKPAPAENKPPAVDETKSEPQGAFGAARPFGEAATLQPEDTLAPANVKTPRHKPPKRGELPSEFTPKDEFDPEIFNRRFSKP